VSPVMTPDALTNQIRTLIPIFDAMGMEALEVAEGRVAARVPVGPNANHFGAMYAGSLFSVAEVLGGLIANTSFPLDGFVPLVKRVDISFLRPATTAVVARAELSPAEVDRIRTEAVADGKAEYLLRAEVTDEAGTVVARTEGTYQLRRM
jgi:thioesterase domain-containing protein